MKKDKVSNKMFSDTDKIIKDIDTNGNGRITKKELKEYLGKEGTVVGIDIGTDDKDYVVLVCPKSGNQHTIKTAEVKNFFEVMGADDNWRT